MSSPLRTFARARALELALDDAPSVTPPLKWAGGKRWQVPYLAPYWSSLSNHRLVEPFCGGLAVAIGLLPAKAYLNDINPHVINFYNWLKRGFELAVVPKNDERTYYKYRERFNELVAAGEGESQEAASLFYYLNKTGYNGLCRFNRKGGYNVPFGSHAKITYATDFSAFRAAFADWKFSSCDFEKLKLKASDVVYADPPYDVEFTQYSEAGFSWKDQVRVAEWLSTHRGPVMLSNQATPRIVKLYRELGFNLRFLAAPRRISCNGDRTPAPEVLALRNLV